MEPPDTPASPRRRGRPRGSEGRELLATARAVFLACGFRGATMDAIAARAHVSKQSLYGSYPSKGALYEAVVRDWVDLGYDALVPHTRALAQAADIREGLLHLAGVLQAGILSPPVLQMRTLIATEADAFPHVAADYLARSWERNLHQLGQALRVVHERGLLDIDDADLAAEQFVWLAIAAPLNRLTLQGPTHHDSQSRLHHVAAEAVTTFLHRYTPTGVVARP